MVLAVMVAGVAWLATFEHDPLELIDDERTWAALAAPCARLQDVAGAVDPGAAPVERAAQLDAVVAAVGDITTAVRALPADALDESPVQGWLGDWDAIGAELERYAGDLAAGRDATFDMPQTDDGYTVTFRMNVAGPDGCTVPAAIESLDRTPPPVPES